MWGTSTSLSTRWAKVHPPQGEYTLQRCPAGCRSAPWAKVPRRVQQYTITCVLVPACPPYHRGHTGTAGEEHGHPCRRLGRACRQGTALLSCRAEGMQDAPMCFVWALLRADGALCHRDHVWWHVYVHTGMASRHPRVLSSDSPFHDYCCCTLTCPPWIRSRRAVHALPGEGERDPCQRGQCCQRAGAASVLQDFRALRLSCCPNWKSAYFIWLHDHAHATAPVHVACALMCEI